MKIYTKTGDGGETSLFGGRRVSKDDLRIETYGTIDELNAILGLAYSFADSDEIKNLISQLQNDLFKVGADLATPSDKINSSKIVRTDEIMVREMEGEIDRIDAIVPDLKNFILPGGSKAASYLHFARTVCRRAERRLIALTSSEEINEQVKVYLNRLSDYLFILARYENFISGTPEVDWKV